MHARYLNIVLASTTSLPSPLSGPLLDSTVPTSLGANMYYGIERKLLVSSDIYDFRTI
jgi:hypothetical protein